MRGFDIPDIPIKKGKKQAEMESECSYIQLEFINYSPAEKHATTKSRFKTIGIDNRDYT